MAKWEEAPIVEPEQRPAWEQAPITRASFGERAVGAVAKGEMTVGQAILSAPAMAVKQYGLVRQADMANAVLKEPDPERQAILRNQMADSEQTFDKVAKWLNKPAELHKVGRKIIEQNHPEWESDPPKNFVDLLTNPDKLGIAIAESMPVLVNAGILTLAGQPQLATALMYVAEGQQAYDQAIQDGASEDDAAVAYAIYGSVSAALEKMQLEGLLKIGKGSYNALLNRTVQKVAGQGLGRATWDVIKVAAQEGLEEMSQGAWQEITAKLVYDKSIPGGLWGFIDRRAQEAYLGFMVGLIPGVAGGVAGAVKGRGKAQEPGVVAPEPTQAPDVAQAGITPVKGVKVPQKPTEPTTEKPTTEPETLAGAAIRLKSGEMLTGSTHANIIREAIAQGRNLDPEFDGPQGSGFVTNTGRFVKVLDQKDGKVVKVNEAWDIAEKAGQLKLEGKDGMAQEFIDRKHLIAEGVIFNGPIPKPKPPTKPILIKKGQAPITQEERKQLRSMGMTIAEIGKTPVSELRQKLGVEEPKPIAELVEPPKPPRMSRRKALKLGHDLPKKLGWNEAKRRDFMQQTVGKSSMEGMTPKEMKTLVEALQGEMQEAGLEYTPKELPIKELISTLEQTKKPTEISQIEELNRGKVRKAIHSTKSTGYSFVTGLERMERFCESLDGHKEGVHYNEIWKPVKQKDELSTENANNRHKEFTDFLDGQKIDDGKWLSKKETIDGVRAKLTPFQKIGVYLHSQNKHNIRQLIRGVGFTPNEIRTIKNSLTPEEKTVADWLDNRLDEQWKPLQQTAAQAGMNLTKLKREFGYAPVIRLDSDLDTQEDFLSATSDMFKGGSKTLEKEGIIQKRKPKAYGKIELDAAIMYMHNVNRVERFMQFAPEAKRLSRIFNNRKFKEALNARTYNQGTKLFNKWIKDSIRGSVNETITPLAKAVRIARRNGIIYAIGYNIPSSMRQTLSLSNAVAVDPLMLKYTPINLAKASNPTTYKKLEKFVYDRSLSVKHASFDRDLATKMNRYALENKLKGKQSWSRRAVRWIRWMDRHTRVVAWKSLYDVGMNKSKGDEVKAIDYADKWLGRTQPMANTKDLPHFFRGGTLENLLTTFQNQINNNGNFYVYDILGAKKSGEIGYTEAGYRVMFSYVLPAMLFGVIGRARLPETIGEVITDLVTYPIGAAVIVGRWITAMIRGWSSGSIAEMGPQELSKLVGAVKRKDLKKIIKYAATTIGAFTGRIPAQAVRTAEGAVDLYTGETEDVRRLVYSKAALKEKKKKPKYSGGYID